jgi:HPt (histidine-containing phosphotransfer) domain-containing protein
MSDPDERRTPLPRSTSAREAVDALVELCGDAAVAAALIDTFLAEGPILVSRVDVAVRAGDAADARTAAHTLKSHGLTFGAPQLAQVAAHVEGLARDRQLAAAGDLVGELAVAFDRAREALGELRDELVAPR